MCACTRARVGHLLIKAQKRSGQSILVKDLSKSLPPILIIKTMHKEFEEVVVPEKDYETSFKTQFKTYVTNKNLTHHHIRQRHLDFGKHDFCVIGSP